MEDFRTTALAVVGAALTVALLLVMAAGVAVLVLPRLGLEMRTVRSESMAPRLDKGDLLVTWPVRAERIEPGDVILFDDGDHTVAHRVVTVSGEQGARVFQTKGDANANADDHPVPQSDVLGRMLFYVPGAGTFADHLRAPYGPIALIVIPCLALLALDGASGLRRPARARPASAPLAPDDARNGTEPFEPTHVMRSAWRRAIAATAVTGIAVAIVSSAAVLLAPDDRAAIPAPQLSSLADAAAISLQSRVEAIARDPSLAEAPEDELPGVLEARRRDTRVDLSTFAVIDTRGVVAAATGEPIETTTDSGALLRTLATGASALLPMRTVKGLPYVDAAAPIVDASGETTGVLLARVSASTLWREGIDASGGSAAITDADGAFFVAPRAGSSEVGPSSDGCATAPLAIDGASSSWSVVSCEANGRPYPFDRGGLVLLAVALLTVAASGVAFARIFDVLPRASALIPDPASERLLTLRDHANEL